MGLQKVSKSEITGLGRFRETHFGRNAFQCSVAIVSSFSESFPCSAALILERSHAVRCSFTFGKGILRGTLESPYGRALGMQGFRVRGSSGSFQETRSGGLPMYFGTRPGIYLLTFAFLCIFSRRPSFIFGACPGRMRFPPV